MPGVGTGSVKALKPWNSAVPSALICRPAARRANCAARTRARTQVSRTAAQQAGHGRRRASGHAVPPRTPAVTRPRRAVCVGQHHCPSGKKPFPMKINMPGRKKKRRGGSETEPQIRRHPGPRRGWQPARAQRLGRRQPAPASRHPCWEGGYHRARPHGAARGAVSNPGRVCATPKKAVQFSLRSPHQ